MKILMVLTSHDKLGNTGRKTGFWLEEFAAPYFTFLDAGATVTVASPKGGQPPLDPVSDTPEGQTELTRRFKQDPAAQAVLANTVRLADVKASDYDAVFYPGGHGPMWDLAEDPQFDRPHRGLLQFRQTGRRGLPRARRAPSCPVPGPTDREGQAGDGLHQRRGGSGPPHQGRAVPRGGRAEAPRRALREGRRTGSPSSSPTGGSSPARTRPRPRRGPRRC